MAIASPPRPPTGSDLDALIREARARQRRRWFGAIAVVAVVVGVALGIYSIVPRHGRSPQTAEGGLRSLPGSSSACGVRVDAAAIFRGGQRVYRERVSRPMGHEVQCSGQTVWVVFANSVGMSHEGYAGVRSRDGGRTWQLLFAQDYPGTGVRGLDAEVGPWILAGTRGAYFVGTCPACGVGRAFGTVSLSVTKVGGRAFRHYDVSALTGYEPTRIRVSGDEVTIWGKRVVRKINSPPFEVYARKAVTLRVA